MNLLDLIKGCKNNDVYAQKHLYNNYGGVVKTVCLRYIRDKNKALDVFHDCFVKILFSVEKYNHQGSFEGWIRRIAVNYCLDQLKKNNKIIFKESYEEKDLVHEEDEIDTSLLMNKALELEISKNDWLEMIAKLPEHFGIVFYLYQIDNFNHAEISDQLGIAINTSKSRLHRAKIGLRTIVEEFVENKTAIEKR